MPNELATQFASMSDDQMLHAGTQYASLTDEAQALVRAEFARRNLEVPDATPEPPVFEAQDLRVIRRCRDQPEAILSRSVLESAGIVCYLRDENMVRLNWGISNVVGGIRVEVAEADVEAAQAILSEPIPSQIAVDGEPDYDQPACPKCGSLDTNFNTTDVKAATVSLFLIGLPLPLFGDRDYRHCNNCATNWVNDPSEITQNDA